MIYYTIYTSVPTGEVSKKVLDDITEESMYWNKDHGITGILICMDGKYIQFLEGEEKDVVEVFEMIKKDPRHNSVNLRVRGYTDRRVFSDWFMGSWMLTNKELEGLSVFDDLKKYINDPTNDTLQSKRFILMMNNILNTWLDHEPERAERLRKKFE